MLKTGGLYIYLLAAMLIISSKIMAQDKYSTQWTAIDKALAESRHRDALQLSNTILAAAHPNDDVESYIKATLIKFNALNVIEEESDLMIRDSLTTQIEHSSGAAKALLQMMLADYYNQYYQNNRYEIMDRKQVLADSAAYDFRTWDAPTFVQTIMQLYMSSLHEEAKALQSISVKNLPLLIPNAKTADIQLRPTLYDVMAQRALAFFSDENTGLADIADKFVLDKKIFLPARDFVHTKFSTQDTLSYSYRYILMLQELTQFRLSQNNTDALIDVTLQRYSYGNNQANFDGKNDAHHDALIALDKEYKHPDIRYAIAEWMSENQARHPEITKQSVVTYCNAIVSDFPASNGAANAKLLLQSILQKNFSLSGENAVMSKKPFLIYTQYQNIEKLYVKIIKIESEAEYNKQRNKGQKEFFKYLAGKKATIAIPISLPKTTDYNSQSTEFKIDGIAAGKYVLAACTDSKWNVNSAQAFGEYYFESSSINYFTTIDGNNIDIHVVDRNSGAPLAGAKIDIFKQEYNYKKNTYDKIKVASMTSSSDGIASFQRPDASYYNYSMLIAYREETLDNKSLHAGYMPIYTAPNDFAVAIFTDRAIYRPGQTIFYKAIAYHNKDYNYTTVSDRIITVKLYDVNGQEVAQQKLTTNRFGSATGSFAAPETGLNGIYTLNSDYGSTTVRVEEYKRPKFEVTFDKVEKEYTVSDKISVNGKATAYTGAPLDGATVTYSIKRETQIPWWCYWYRYRPTSESQIIGSGATTTNADGSYTIDFTALPDLSVDKTSLPSFTYIITADVTNINGETHSASTTVRVGYLGIEVNVGESEPWLSKTENKLSITIANLNGKPAKAIADIKIFTLIEPPLQKDRLWASPSANILSNEDYKKIFPQQQPQDDPNNPIHWEKGALVQQWNTGIVGDTLLELSNNIQKEGYYLIELNTKDDKGNPIVITKAILLSNPEAKQLTPKSFLQLDAPLSMDNNGATTIRVGTSVPNAYVFVVANYKGKSIFKKSYTINNTILSIEIPIDKSLKGGVDVYAALAYDNRLYEKSAHIYVPFNDLKNITMQWKSFRDKLLPGQQEKWILSIKGAAPDSLELLSTLYDASLDAFVGHQYALNTYFPEYTVTIGYNNYYIFAKNSDYYEGKNFNAYHEGKSYSYPYLTDLYIGDYSYYRYMPQLMAGTYALEEVMVTSANVKNKKYMRKGEGLGGGEDMAVADSAVEEAAGFVSKVAANYTPNGAPPEAPKPSPSIRTNLQELAFFFPQVYPQSDGTVQLEFTIPEALTKWKFLGLAHTPAMQTATISDYVVTQKDLMVTPNVPRFVRQGDTLVITAAIQNMSEISMNGKASLRLYNAINNQEISSALLLSASEQNFNAVKGSSDKVRWTLAIPDYYDAITYEIDATTAHISDGERGAFPVLSNKILITETLPLWMSGKGKKTFTLEKLKNNTSTTLKNHSLTLEYTPNPVWYAVQALPYIMEFPHECAEQLFARYYANTFATYIVKSNPAIQKVFEKWQSADALISNLEKNPELKNIILEETPWVRQAQSETEQKKRISLLFDYKNMATEQENALKKLLNLQTPNGGFTWFTGMRDNYYITLHILNGMGHLDKLKVIDIDEKKKLDNALSKALKYADKHFYEQYESIKKYPKYETSNHLDYDAILFMYMRSFYTQKMDNHTEEAFNFFVNQAIKYWNTQNLYMKAMIALTLQRNGKADIAKKIVEGMRQSAVYKEEMGMYWKENEKGGWYWYQAPVETQALLIEAFADITPSDVESVQKMKIWLLKQKQTTHWSTTKSTTEAIYALLLQGSDWINTENNIKVSLGKEKIDMSNSSEAGTGYTKVVVQGKDIQAQMATVTLEQKSNVPSWGALYWQYFENIDKISSQQSGIKIAKQLYKAVNGARGEDLLLINENTILQPGDKVYVRMEISTDRDLEYVHLKDLRAAGFEPENVLSQYKYDHGLGYYESTKDVATHFFIDFLPKGVYVFEYPLRTSLEGNFSGGITQIECMYAPEFKAHSKGFKVKIGK